MFFFEKVLTCDTILPIFEDGEGSCSTTQLLLSDIFRNY